MEETVGMPFPLPIPGEANALPARQPRRFLDEMRDGQGAVRCDICGEELRLYVAAVHPDRHETWVCRWMQDKSSYNPELPPF